MRSVYRQFCYHIFFSIIPLIFCMRTAPCANLMQNAKCDIRKTCKNRSIHFSYIVLLRFVIRRNVCYILSIKGALRFTCPYLFVTVLCYSVTLHVCTSLYTLPIYTCLQQHYTTVLHYMSVPTSILHYDIGISQQSQVS